MSTRRRVTTIEHWLAPRWSRGSAAVARQSTRPVLAPLSAAAIRVPERLSAQMALVFPSASPQLFVHEGARQALERRLKSAFPGRTVVLQITDNRCSIISHSLKHGVLHARIHHMFLDASPRVVSALVRYLATDDREASQIVSHYIEANGGRLARRRPRAIPLMAKGTHHDLLALFKDLNERYFNGSCHALITWGNKVKRRNRGPRRAIRLGSYSSLERVIRIHPVLDRAWVPRYFVAYVIYHEMLHHMVPSARGTSRHASAKIISEGGDPSAHKTRRTLHPPEFLEREREFRNFDRALEWERRHISRLLRMR